jgi:hypothetical protein
LCYTKYAYKEGVRIYQLTDVPIDKLEKFVKDIDKNLSKEKDLNDWFVEYIDIPDVKVPKPLKSIISYKTTDILKVISDSIHELEDLRGEKGKAEVSPPRRSPPRGRAIGERTGERIAEMVITRAEDERRDIVIRPVEVIDYKSRTVIELKAIAKSRGLKGYSALRKMELIDFLKKLD